MKNLKLLIIILIIFAVGLVGAIVVINLRDYRYTNNISALNTTYENVWVTQNYIYEEQEKLNEFIEEDIEQEQPQYDDLDLMEFYLKDFSDKALTDVEQAYNLLNEEYRDARFGSIDKFKEYIESKQLQIANIELRQFTTEDKGFDRIFKGTDENGNYYYIRELGYMDYTIILDNYTMQADYSNLDDEEKIRKHVQKFILMVNSADYTNAYSLLEPTFKETNFPTEQDFITYLKNNWFERNIIASRVVREDGICVVTMREDIATTSNKIEKQFKVNMLEGIEFTIEFDV